MASLDCRSPLPAITLDEFLGHRLESLGDQVRLRPGAHGNGSINVFESFLLALLVRMIKPTAIIEIGTFRGGTTGHLFHNAPPDAIIYTLDLPADVRPCGITDSGLAATKTRDFLPDSPRVKLRLVDTSTWDGTLDTRVQFAFIDGNHSYNGVRNDTEKVLSLLDEVGCVCWHDCLGRDYGYGVHRYLLELRSRGLRIFRVKGVHEVSSLAMWMTQACEQRVGLTLRADI